MLLLRNHYAHAYSCLPRHPGYAAAWPTILADTRRIIDRVRAAGIVITGPTGHGWPLTDPDDGIAVNGDAGSHLDHDTFTLPPPWRPTSTRHTDGSRAICVTNRKPYDLAVSAILLRCLLLIPGLVTVTSNGHWNREWAHGTTPFPTPTPTPTPQAAGRPEPPRGARGIVAELFDMRPTTSPLQPDHHIL